MVAKVYDAKQVAQAKLLSPAEDESSREVFGRIKKLNIVPETRKIETPGKIFILLLEVKEMIYNVFH